ncbi:MAG TPA: glycosyltransferase family 4 protein [Herpetosiphonaceae bacterium]
MKIAMIVAPWFSVPPTTHGGTETLVNDLVAELVARGDEVTLYAVGSSRTSAMLRCWFDEPQDAHLATSGRAAVEAMHALFAYREAARAGFDLIHDHAGLLSVAIGAPMRRPPILHTIHRILTPSNQPFYRLLAEFPGMYFSTISHAQRGSMPDLPSIATIHNALDPSIYPLVREKERYLAYLGRMRAEKGCHLAIALARRSGWPLKLAGRIDDPHFFHTQIEPQLGQGIEYVGEVNLQEKAELLSHARALVFPAQWEEPFGLVAIEALACGTPVIAMPRGGLREIVRSGIDGFLADDLDGMLRALKKIDTIDPAACRRRVEESFSRSTMAIRYQEVYRRILAG